MLADPTLRAKIESVQEFPPANVQFVGAALTERGPLLPPYASRECDTALRALYRHQYNTLVQGAFTGLAKKIASAPYKITGEDVMAVSHFQDVFQYAQFGEGWSAMLARVVIAFLTQNIGAFIEVIGPGDPNTPLVGPVTGLAALDSSRCYLTGNPEFPVIYYSQWTGKLHRLHTTRVIRLVDMPDYEERLYGYGMCALYRAAAIADRQIKMGQYISSLLDDRPKPGIMQVSGTTRDKIDPVLSQYAQRRYNDAQDVWGQTLWVYSLDPEHPLKIEPLSFASTPDKFDFTAYTNLDVNALALALGVDKQELWELGGGALGSGAQSAILAAKARGKALGDLFTQLERSINLYVLPESLEFRFDYQDDEADTARAQIDAQHMTIAQQMSAMPNVFTPEQIRAYLIANSRSMREALSGEKLVTAIDDDRPVRQNDGAGLVGDAPPAVQEPPIEQGGGAPVARKELSDVRARVQRDLQRGLDPERVMLDGGRAAYADARGGPPDDQAEAAIAAWLNGLSVQISLYRQNGSALALLDALATPYEMGRADKNRAQFVDLLVALFGAGAGLTGARISKASFVRRMLAILEARGRQAFQSGLRDGGVTELRREDVEAFNRWLDEQTKFVTDFADEVFEKGLSAEQVKQRAELWASQSLQAAYQIGLRNGAQDDDRYEWVLGATVDHCDDCLRLNGQVHTMKDWQASGYLPQARTLQCGGWNCLCRLVKTNAPVRGAF